MRAPLRTSTLLALVLVSPLAGQSVWTRVPALPRACYSGQDTFQADAERVRTELEAQVETQQTVNRGFTERILAMDQATLQQRMMAAVQKNPAKSQEIMQAMQSLGTPASQGAAREADQEESDLRARKTKLMEDYQAESNKVLGPSHARAVEASVQTRDAAWAEYNRQYETVVCPRWFAKQVPELLASFRTYLVEQRIPRLAKAESTSLPMYEMLGLSTNEFRPIAEMQGVVDYLRFAADLYGLRSNARSPN